MKITNIILSIILTLSLISCKKEVNNPTNLNQTNVELSNGKIHNIDSQNKLEFVFWVSNENVNGTIEVHSDGEIETFYISDLTLENRESYSGNSSECFVITKYLSNVDLSEDTYFFVKIDVGREINIRNENYINNNYMFDRNNRDFPEPSFKELHGVEILEAGAWVLPKGHIADEREDNPTY